MDEVILHIPRVETIQLKDIFLKEEEFKKSNGKYCFKVWTPSFFERINKLQKILLNENQNFEIITNKKNSILKFIREYKEEHIHKVMENNLYSLYLIFEKNEKNENFGICGWVPRLCDSWKKKISHLEHEEKLIFCHLSEDEKKFKFQREKKIFDFLSIFFKEEYFYNGFFNIPTNHIIWFKRNMLNEIKRKCCDGNFVCPHDKICDGHKFIDYIELLFSSIAFAVEEKKVF